jgi:glycosyltransferase involved in cell wall biosynthesis
VHVGLLIYGSLDIISGGFIYDRHLVRYLREAGDRVDVISLPWPPYGLSLLDNLNAGLYRRLQQASFDVLLEDELVHPSVFWLNQRLRHRVTYPIVAIVHHLRSCEARPAWKNQLYRWVERQYLASLAGFIFNSHATRTDVERLVGSGRPAVIASPGGDRLTGQVTAGQVTLRAEAPGPFNIICVANLIPRKQVQTLITALASLPRQDWQLSVAGSLTMDTVYVGSLRRQIEADGLSARISLLGTVSDQDLAVLLPQHHLLAVPSSYEGFGIVYLEGMHFGLPAIAGIDGAASEIITHGENGFLVPPGDAAALARSLSLLMEDRELLARMSLTAHRRAAAHATWNDSAARARGFLQSFIGLRPTH